MKLHFFLLPLVLLPAAALQAGFVSGQPADMVLGGIEPEGMLQASDIAVHGTTQKVFVADAFRHRVLRFSSQAALQNGGLAEAVFGAADMSEITPGSGAVQLNGPQGISVDSSGRLWVADTGNHRVLRFDNALTAPSGAAASVVLGQPNFTSTTSGLAANRLSSPEDVELDTDGRLWVADTANRRVLRFDNAPNRTSGVNADGVLGQPNMTSSSSNSGASGMDSPRGLAVETSGSTTVRLWVVDWYHSRVLGFDNPGAKANGAAAQKLLGQTSFDGILGGRAANRIDRPYKVAVDNGGLWIPDFNNYRTLYFASAGSKPIGGNADLVLGQLDFTAWNIGNGSATPGSLNLPVSIAASAGRVWIGDGNSRVVRHDNAATKGNGTDADGVLGAKTLSAASFFSASEIVIDSISGKLFVADGAGNRVLRYPAARTLTWDSVPEAVLGQPDFSTTSGGSSAAKLDGPGAMSMDGLGNLWVVDGRNHRVVRYANAATATTGTAASQVLGQTGFNLSGTGLAANRFNQPSGLAVEWGFNASFQVVVRRLWVSDRLNNRVLRFDSPVSLGNGGSAAGVFGAANLTAAGAGTLNASGIQFPGALAVDFSGRLWVADNGHNRVLRFDAAVGKANNASADGVLLQPNFTTSNAAGGSSISGLGIGAADSLFISRSAQQDVIRFESAHTKPASALPDLILRDTGKIHANIVNPGRPMLDPTTGRLWVGSSKGVYRFSPSIFSTITGYGFNAQGRFFLNILGTGGETYEIRSSTDLLNWNTIEQTTTVPGTVTTLMSWTASAPPSGPKKFYRLQAP